VRSDILNRKAESSKKESGVSLSLLTACSLFSLFSLVALAILVVTYNSSQLVVDNERQLLEKQSGTISDLVLEDHIHSLEQFIGFLSEEISLQNKKQGDDLDEIIQAAFFTQKENTVNFIAYLASDGKLVSEINTELFAFPKIRKHIKQAFPGENSWFWAMENMPSKNPPAVLLYYKEPILDKVTGRLDGYLVGGIFLNENISLVRQIRDRTGAVMTSLLVADRVLVSDADEATKIETNSSNSDPVTNSSESQSGHLFSNPILLTYFPDANISIQSVFPRVAENSLDDLYLISAVWGLILILLLSVFSVLVARTLFLKPLMELITYARKVERREAHPELTSSSIVEFNEVGRNLKSVLSALQESEKRFEDFANVTSDSIWETDAEHRYTFVSRNGAIEIQLLESKILGKTRWGLEGVDASDEIWLAHRAQIEKRLPFKNFIFQREDDQGNISYRSTSGKPIFDASGEFIGYRGTSSNITTEIESQLEAEKIQNQLRQSQKLEVVGQLTGGIAHDFNNLLAVVIGNIELVMEKGTLSKSDEKILSDAMRGAEKGAALTHQLLAYSRQQTLQPAVVSPCEVIVGIESLLRRVLEERINFELLLGDNWSIKIDPNELENALMNLVVNARDAIKGSGTISIETFDIEIDEAYATSIHGFTAGNYVCVVVRDTGCGIPNDVKEHVFEPFFTTKEVGMGSGLGLSMVFGFAHQSGGHVSIDSEIDKGTSVKLFLPHAASDNGAKQLET